MDKLDSQTLHAKILLPHEKREQELSTEYRLARQFGKKSEIKKAKQAWEASLDICVYVDQALSEFRDQMERVEA